LKPVWEHAAGLIDKTTTDYGEETFHGFTDRHEAMFSWEEYNMQHEETPMPLEDFLNMKRKEKGMGPVPVEVGRQRVLLAKVDCTVEQQLCRQQRIMGFPTVRVYTPRKEGQSDPTHSFREYDGDRTAQDLLQYVHETMPGLDGFTQEDQEFEELSRQHESELSSDMEKRIVQNGDSHGCNVVGSVTVKKVPGTLMLTAHSNYKSLSLEYLNMSHIIHHMAYRPTDDPMLRMLDAEAYENYKLDSADGEYNAYGPYARALMRSHKQNLEEKLPGHGMGNVVPFLFPLDQKRFPSSKARTVLMHYLKVVHTFVTPWRGQELEMYQHQVHSTSDVILETGGHPTLNFTYDMSPLSYSIKGEYEATADFLTSTCAIIGGVFTVIGLFDNVIYHSAANMVKFLS